LRNEIHRSPCSPFSNRDSEFVTIVTIVTITLNLRLLGRLLTRLRVLRQNIRDGTQGSNTMRVDLWVTFGVMLFHMSALCIQYPVSSLPSFLPLSPPLSIPDDH
jgi:hypothetical protein